MTRLALLLAAVLALAIATPAPAGFFGKYLQNCPRSGIAQVDPVTSRGVPASDHEHDFFCGTVINSAATSGELLAAPTTAFLQANHSLYIAPPLVTGDGTVVHASSAQFYYAAGGSATPVQPYPVGLRFRDGNPNSTVLQSTNKVRWHCSYPNPPQLNAPPTSCPPGVGVSLDFIGPSCWDGMNLDSADHISHMSVPATTATCPLDHPIRVPQIRISFLYATAAVGACPVSDHGIPPCGRSAHWDDLEAQDPAQQDQVTRCLNDPARSSETSPLCGVFTTLPNSWESRVRLWAGVVGYVASNGDPTYGITPPTIP